VEKNKRNNHLGIIKRNTRHDFFGSSLFPVGKGELRKIAPRGNSGEDACGEIPDLGVEADGSVLAAAGVKCASRQVRRPPVGL